MTIKIETEQLAQLVFKIQKSDLEAGVKILLDYTHEVYTQAIEIVKAKLEKKNCP